MTFLATNDVDAALDDHYSIKRILRRNIVGDEARHRAKIASRRVPEFTAHSLLKSPTVATRDVCCEGSCSRRGAEEYATATELVFPYRGVYVRHLGQEQAVAEANQVLFFNAM